MRKTHTNVSIYSAVQKSVGADRIHRRPEFDDRMAQARFGDRETGLLYARTRLPTSHNMMRMAAPLARAANQRLGTEVLLIPKRYINDCASCG